MTGLATGGPGFVAVGSSQQREVADAAVWTSADGQAWSRVPPDQVVLGGPGDQLMSAVTAGGPGLVAVGFEFHGRDEEDAAVWTSTDGLTWSRVPHAAAVFGGSGSQEMSAVVAGGPGLVAVGFDYSKGEGDAAVWTSVDGRVWSRVRDGSSGFGGPGLQSMAAVVNGGPGLVAVGVDDHGRDGEDAAVWTSIDGLAWARTPHDDQAFGGPMDQAMTAVVAGGPGLVAVGVDDSIGDWRAAAWVSVDGVAWSRVLHQEVAFGGPDAQITSALVVGGPGLVAVGSEWLGGGWDAAAWTSIDGRAWSHVQHQEAEFGGADWQMMEAVAPGPSALVAVGSDHSGGDDDAAVWASPPGP